MIRMLRICLAPLVLLLADGAHGHGLDLGQLGLQLAGDRLTLEATPPTTVLQEFDGDGDGRLSVTELQTQREAIARRLDDFLQLRDQLGRAPELTLADVLLPAGVPEQGAADHIVIRRKYRFAEPPAGLLLFTELAERSGRPLLVLLKADDQPLQSSVLATGESTLSFDVARPSSWQTLGRWLPIGFGHVLAGADHLLFLLLLVWGTVSLRTVTLWLTAFTVGHSLTLALILLRIMLAPAWAEAAIAASIVITGLHRLYRWQRPLPATARDVWLQAALATTFGLVHGMGFAGALSATALLSEQRWPTLIGFNLGIEAGQLLVVLALWPLLQCMRRWQWQMLAQGVMGTATGLGLFWLVQRLQ